MGHEPQVAMWVGRDIMDGCSHAGKCHQRCVTPEGSVLAGKGIWEFQKHVLCPSSAWSIRAPSLLSRDTYPDPWDLWGSSPLCSESTAPLPCKPLGYHHCPSLAGWTNRSEVAEDYVCPSTLPPVHEVSHQMPLPAAACLHTPLHQALQSTDAVTHTMHAETWPPRLTLVSGVTHGTSWHPNTDTSCSGW